MRHAAGCLLACGLLAGMTAACSSVRSDEALAMLDVTAAGDVPAFTTARFSVAGRPEVRPHELGFDGKSTLHFGYYLPGPSGTLRITGQALAASCVVGSATAEVTVQLGRVSASVPLTLQRLTDIDPGCAQPADASVADGNATADAAADAATDARRDATPPPADAGPPACLAATKVCPGAAACCSGLTCGTTSLGKVCCGNFGASCTRVGGEDCCGQLECINGGCCLPATYACTGTSCCAGLVCGTTSLGRVCCGNAGAPCIRPDGADCCGALRCVNNVCRT